MFYVILFITFLIIYFILKTNQSILQLPIAFFDLIVIFKNLVAKKFVYVLLFTNFLFLS
jgi:hypothetical protein